MRREEKRREQEKVKKAKGRKNALAWAAVILAVAAVGFGIFKFLASSAPDVEASILKTCVNHTSPGMHIHPNLRLVINGELQDIPANIGVTPGCMRPLHTHDNTGRLHIEFSRQRNFTLGDFFKVWDKPFSSLQLFDYVVNETHSITMTVNGAANGEYEKYVLKDHDQIEIRYEEKK